MKPWSKWLGALLTCVLALTLLFCLPATAEAATYGDLTYQVSNGEVTITDCSESASGDLVIPDTIEGYPVTSIGTDAFRSCKRLDSITIPDSVTTIGDYAFYYCTWLTSVTFGDSVTNIGRYTFGYCSRLTSITISDSVTTIEGFAFTECDSLTSITIPDGVATIGERAFFQCDSLTSVTLGDSVTTIGDTAFWYCTSLTSVTFGDSVTIIGDGAFDSCSSLTSVTLGDSVTTIGDSAFDSCSSLTSVTLGDSVTSIGSDAFFSCQSLASVIIPASVTNIGEYAFCNCSSLTNVYYTGTNSGWGRISIGVYNDPLRKATRHYVEQLSCTLDHHDYLYCADCDSCFDLMGSALAVYTVQFKNWDGMILSSNEYHQGDIVTAPETPAKAADNTYTYTFAGWDKKVSATAHADATYTATYTPAYIDYTVTFKDWDGTVLSEKTYHYGDTVTAPETPTKAADNTYTYPFAGWDKPLICNGNSVITATYTPTYIDYTVIFKDEDGTVISEKIYHYGDTVEIPTDPTKAADNTYTYAFSGWDKEVAAVVGDTTYAATYTPTYIDYTVTFKEWDGSVISEKTYHYGDAVEIPADPTRVADKTYTYAFNRWDKEVTACAGNAVYTATYTPTYIDYTVTFKDWDGTVLSEKTYHYGDTIIAPETPTKAADNTYTYPFAGWDKPLVCAGDDVITATYTPTYIDYTVIFKDEDGTVVSQKTYHYGDTVEIPADPTKAADNTYTYAFSGWDKEVAAVAGNTTYTATYTPTYIDYTVIFKDWDGFPIEKKTYHYGDTVTAPADPIKAGDRVYTYTFTGWDPQVTVCTADAVYTATYFRTMIDYVVTFQNADGTVISQKTYHYGDSVEIPTDFSAPEGYKFASWDKEIVTTVDGNAVYTAIYELDWLKGDFDSSGNVDDADALYLLRHTLFADRYPIPGDGDVDGNGSVDDADALYLLRHTLFSDRYPLYPKKEN